METIPEYDNAGWEIVLVVMVREEGKMAESVARWEIK